MTVVSQDLWLLESIIDINKLVIIYCITSMSLELAISWISPCFSIAIFRQNPVFMFEILSRSGFILQISPVSAPLTSPECLPEEI